MVLSNKKLKQRLRVAKAELIVAAESQNNMNDKLENVDSKASHPLKLLMDKDAKRAKLSKREKRRLNAENDAEGVRQKQIGGSVDEKSGIELKPSDVDKKKKKRKRDVGGTLETQMRREKQRQNAEHNLEDVTQKQIVGSSVDEKSGVELNPSDVDNKKKKKKQRRDEGETLERRMRRREERRHKTEQYLESVRQKQIAGDVDEKSGIELKPSDVDEKEKKKRNRDEVETPEKIKEEKPKKPKKKKKTKNKRKPKKNSEKMQAKEESQQQNGGQISGEQLVVGAPSSDNIKELEPLTKVYVGGIPYYSTEDDIRSYFESCGSITDVDCMEFPDTGKFRGIAIISFKTEAAAKRALALDGSDMGGLFLKIQPFKSARVASKTSNFSPVPVEGYNRIYVGNLSWDVTEDDLKKLFSDCAISSIRFGEDKETGEFKGYAHIDFADSVSLNLALTLDQSIVCGRSVRISSAVPKKGAISKLKTTPTENRGDRDKVCTVNNNQYISSAKVNPFNKNEVVNGAHGADVSTVSKDQENYTANIKVVNRDHVKSSDKVTIDSKGENNNIEVIAEASSKTRRRTCYECGEKGHISSLCPKKQATDLPNPSGANVTADSKDQENYTANVKAINRDDVNSSIKVAMNSKIEENNTEVIAEVSSKTRRRTCYECGEKGHISSLCPKKQATDLANPSGANVAAASKDQEDYNNKVCATSKDQIDSNHKATAESKSEESNIEGSAVSSKIRRRTCYECGEKGHISSLCPKKQSADLVNPSAA